MIASHTARGLDAELSALGFALVGGQRFAHDDVTLNVTDAWLTLHAKTPRDASACDWLGRPGLWKPGADPAEQWCDIPRRACTSSGHEDAESGTAEAIAWAMATRDAGWQPPVLDATATPVTPRALTVRAGALTCQGELHTDPRRLWIDFAIAAVPGDLDPARRQWLAALVEATHRTRMVRVVADVEERALHARIDLTGLRSPVREALLAVALPRLQATVERLLPAVDLLTDAGFASRAMELGNPCRKSKTTKRGRDR